MVNQTPKGVGELVYLSKEMEKVEEQMITAASCSYPVLVVGPSGSGKKLIAKTIHNYSKRASNPFKIINCGAISNSLIKLEIFGQQAESKGLIENNKENTLILDYVDQLDSEGFMILINLLDMLEYKRIKSIRIIAITTTELIDLQTSKSQEVDRFRNQLFSRFVIKIKVPSLAERAEDISVIAEEILRRENTYLKLSDEAKAHLINKEYPYNVRELENLMKLVIVEAKIKNLEVITSDLFGEQKMSASEFNVACSTLNYHDAMLFFEKKFLEKIVKLANGDIKKIIKSTGMAKTTFYRRANTLNIKVVNRE
ncbi:MAG: sigma 54-interacting transcriptional regulator [Blastocatellia bacterium]